MGEEVHHLITPAERETVRIVTESAGSRFRKGPPDMDERVKRFALSFLDRFYERFPDHPLLAPTGPIRHEVDCPPDELPGLERTRSALAPLAEWLRDAWGNRCRGVYFAPSVWFGLDDRLLFVAIDPEDSPSVEQFRSLTRWLREAERAAGCSIPLYVLTSRAALHIGIEQLQRSWNRTMHPLCQPDVFALMSRPEFRLVDGEDVPPLSPQRNSVLEQFIAEERHKYAERLRSLHPEDSRPEYVRILFTKAVQFEVLSRALQGPVIRYPLTIPAILRGAAEQHLRLAPDLHRLVCSGDGSASGPELARMAVDYLTTVASPVTTRVPVAI